MVIASRYSRSKRMDAGSVARTCSSVYRLLVLSHEESQVMRPVSSRPTMPPWMASTMAPPPCSAWCPRRGPSGRRSSPSLPNMNRTSMPCVSIAGSVPTNTRPLLSASAICEKWLRSVNAPSENDAPCVTGSCAHPSCRPSGTPSKSAKMRRLTNGPSVMACSVSAATTSPPLPAPPAAPRAASNGLTGVCFARRPRTAAPRERTSRPIEAGTPMPRFLRCGVCLDMPHILPIQPDMKPIE